MKLLIIGSSDGTSVGASLCRAARQLGAGEVLFPGETLAKERQIDRLRRKLFSTRAALRINPSAALRLADTMREFRPDLVIVTGLTVLPDDFFTLAKSIGSRTAVFLTDDPWNPNLYFKFPLGQLAGFNAIFSPRQRNLSDLRGLGCRSVTYLPFGFDPELFFPEVLPSVAAPVPDLLFVGGADRDRVPYATAMLGSGLSVGLAGGYWKKFLGAGPAILGHVRPAELRRLTQAVKVNVVLSRASNRDGHVMRSFEVPACGGAMVVDDSPEHRTIFGKEGDAVLFYNGPEEMIAKAKMLVADDGRREKMRLACHQLIVAGGHTYRDRLAAMLKVAKPETGESETAGG